MTCTYKHHRFRYQMADFRFQIQGTPEHILAALPLLISNVGYLPFV
ncbi:MAG: hypothetical protein IKZ59_00025 [Clostridia bacterium]|nr:hypothetical protein [Clostridia bacterium]